jgi:hypothetical protein
MGLAMGEIHPCLSKAVEVLGLGESVLESREMIPSPGIDGDEEDPLVGERVL